MHIRIGTRGSKLALWQAYHVEECLQKAGMSTEIVKIETKGDKILNVSIAKIGSKGVFTEEIEAQLSAGSIDIAVHSAKDMQSTLPNGFELIAFMEREVANDVIVSHNKDFQFDAHRKIVLGTSSTRRVATLKQLYPLVETVAVRGNLQTRIRKMEEGACEALMLAYAGVHRMGYDDMIVERLSLDTFVPAVGQGSVAIEVFETLDPNKRAALRKALNHKETESCLLAERAFLKTMDGGCSIPVFGMATISNDGLQMTGGIISLDGQQRVRKQLQGALSNPAALGVQMAQEVLSNGGKEILQEIKENLQDL